MSVGNGPEESMFRNSGLIGYLVKRLNEKYPGKQIGKTVIQKMMYMLSRSDVANFDFSMYITALLVRGIRKLNFAERNGVVDIDWKDEKGYFVNQTDRVEDFVHLLSSEDKRVVDELVARFGCFKAVDLSLIATALYLQRQFRGTG